MKEGTVLRLTILLTFIVEFVFVYLTYQVVGTERLPAQIGRILLQCILIVVMLISNSNKGLYLLAGYHVLTSVIIFSKPVVEVATLVLGIYHFVIAMLIVFHSEVQNWIVAFIQKQRKV